MADNAETETREATQPEGHSVRPVIEHALIVHFDGNAELARTLIDRLIAEQGEES